MPAYAGSWRAKSFDERQETAVDTHRHEVLFQERNKGNWDEQNKATKTAQ